MDKLYGLFVGIIQGIIFMVIVVIILFGGMKLAFGESITYHGPGGSGAVYINELGNSGMYTGSIIIHAPSAGGTGMTTLEWQDKYDDMDYNEYMMDRYGDDNPELSNVLNALEEWDGGD